MIVEAIIDWAERTPGAPALIERQHTVSYSALLRGVRAGAAWLYGRGVRAGDTVALALEPEPAQTRRQASLYYACAWLGAVFLPLYPGVPAALRGLLAARFNAHWLVAADAFGTSTACTRLDPAGFDHESDAWRAHPAPRGGNPAHPLCFEFTSGTTGPPKVVLFTASQFATITGNSMKFFGWSPSDRLLPAVRLPGKAGLRSMARIHAAGGALVNVPFPETRVGLADVVEEFGVTLLHSVPWQLRRLLASEPPAGRRPPLRHLATSGASIAPQEIRAARAVLTANMHVTYACCELSIVAHLRPGDPFDAAPMLVRGMEGQAVDSEGRALPAGASGRLRFRAPWMPAGYVGNERATAEGFREGWFYPGDAGSIDAAGRVTPQGRADDTINHGGTKIVPHAVEQELLQHPDIADVALMGVPDAEKGELPVAFVVLRRSIPFKAVQDFCTARMDASQIPHVMLTVDSIPRNPEGKVLRDRLLEIYREWSARR